MKSPKFLTPKSCAGGIPLMELPMHQHVRKRDVGVFYSPEKYCSLLPKWSLKPETYSSLKKVRKCHFSYSQMCKCLGKTQDIVKMVGWRACREPLCNPTSQRQTPLQTNAFPARLHCSAVWDVLHNLKYVSEMLSDGSSVENTECSFSAARGAWWPFDFMGKEAVGLILAKLWQVSVWPAQCLSSSRARPTDSEIPVLLARNKTLMCNSTQSAKKI